MRYITSCLLERSSTKRRDNKCWHGCGEREPLYIVVGMQELLYGPGIPLPVIYSKKTETLTLKDICTPIFTAALFIVAKTWKQPKCLLVDEWIKKLYIHTQWNITQP